MSASGGTLQSVIIEFERLVQPVKNELSAAPATISFFSRLGIVLDNGQATTIASAASATITAAEDLATQVSNIITHVESESYAELTQDTKKSIEDIAAIINGIKTIGNSVHGIHTAISAEEVVKRLINYLLFRYIQNTGGVNEGLEFFGLLEREEFNIDSTDPANPEYELATYRFDRIGSWLKDPVNTAKDLYDWGKNDFDGSRLFSLMERVLLRLGLPVYYDDSLPLKRLDLFIADMVPKTDSSPPGVLIRIKNPIFNTTIPFDAGNTINAELSIGINAPADTGIYFLPDGTVAFRPLSAASSFEGKLGLKLGMQNENGNPFIIFGEAGSSRVEMKELIVTAGTEVNWTGNEAKGNFQMQGNANGLKIIIDGTKGDGFLTKILPNSKIEADFDLLMGISNERGFYFGGSSALEVRLPMHIDLGPVSIEGLTITIKLKDGKIPVQLGADIKATLGPIVAVVQNVGLEAVFSFPADNNGNIGPLQLDIGFKPPNGVGLSIDGGAIKGGGFLYLDSDKGEYFGAIELTFSEIIALKAIGIINTKMPDGSKGFAMLILITAEFTPIQLGFGFTLNGVGGLLAVNRSTDIDALKAGIKTGAVSSILFPQDIVANISRIISDLKSIFPITQDHFLIAPMAKIGWGTPVLVTLEMGIIVDIPSPRLVIVGVLRCILPTEDAPILKLQVNFGGGIDFDAGKIWFDASLFDSRLLIYTLTGDMALRIGWKDPMFVLSVGGFHPAFNEVPPDLTGMKRIMISLLSGDNPRIGAMTYFAVTSNTVQSGARVELYAAAGGFNIYGFLGYDLLVQFNPFHFVADISAGLALRSGSHEIAGINVHCQLSGPTPWHAHGSASISFFFFSVSVGFDESWGDAGPAQVQEEADVLTLVKNALKDKRNWKADIPVNTNLSVTLRKTELPEGEIIIHPFGVLSVSQKVVPLGITISKFGNKKPSSDTFFDVTCAGDFGIVQEEFAIANFQELTDDQKLARKSFEKIKSGLSISPSDSSKHGVEMHKDVDYEMSYVSKQKGTTTNGGRFGLLSSLYTTLLADSAITNNAYSASKKTVNAAPAKVLVQGEKFMVVSTASMDLYSPEMIASSEAEAYSMHDELIKNNPAMKGTIQVISNFELN